MTEDLFQQLEEILVQMLTSHVPPDKIKQTETVTACL